jgi:hypothetical protein
LAINWLCQDHIRELKGDEQCKIDPNADRCYGETEEERRNIVGKGTQITKENAKPWLDHLSLAIGPDWRRFQLVLMASNPNVRPLPPRKIRIEKRKKFAFAGY